MTDRYAVIGNPIEQSKSPLIHTAFAQVTGQDLAYTKVLSPLGEFAQTVDAFRAAGGRGMNVTAPFKLDAFAYATDLAPSAQLAGAVNALKFEGDKVFAENFDALPPGEHDLYPASTVAAITAQRDQALARVAELEAALRTADHTFAENGILASHAARQEIQAALTKGQP